MELTAGLMLDVWELVSEYMPTSKKEDVANKLVKIFSDRGLDQDEFESIRGEDHHLDTAIDHFREADADTDDYDYESEDYEDD